DQPFVRDRGPHRANRARQHDLARRRHGAGRVGARRGARAMTMDPCHILPGPASTVIPRPSNGPHRACRGGRRGPHPPGWGAALDALFGGTPRVRTPGLGCPGRLAWVLASALLAVALLAAPSGAYADAIHQVRQGETLASIAQRYYGEVTREAVLVAA